jgi:hypothetical protein
MRMQTYRRAEQALVIGGRRCLWALVSTASEREEEAGGVHSGNDAQAAVAAALLLGVGRDLVLEVGRARGDDAHAAAAAALTLELGGDAGLGRGARRGGREGGED